jgi:hypothetical protein
VTLSPQGTPVVRELDADGAPTGRPRAALPTPKKSDDPQEIAAARSEFTLLRKQLGDIARLQTIRLEQAMVGGRTWTVAEHREHVAGNPLLRSLVQPLVWAVGAGPDRTLVRVEESGGYLCVDEAELQLPENAALSLSLPHPLDLTDAERSAWQAHLADFDLVAPFQQLDRLVTTVDGIEGVHLPDRFLPAIAVDPRVLVGALERLGGGRGPTGDGAVVEYCVLPFPRFGQTVVIGAGFWIGSPEPIGIAFVDLCPTGAEEVTLLDWSRADPRVLSETVRVLALLGDRLGKG